MMHCLPRTCSVSPTQVFGLIGTFHSTHARCFSAWRMLTLTFQSTGFTHVDVSISFDSLSGLQHLSHLEPARPALISSPLHLAFTPASSSHRLSLPRSTGQGLAFPRGISAAFSQEGI